MFGAFERDGRRRATCARASGERFVSVIAIFSLIGIALGVATLIIVMSVMNGFRRSLLSRILGVNGDLGDLCGRRAADGFDASTRASRAAGRGVGDAGRGGPGVADRR